MTKNDEINLCNEIKSKYDIPKEYLRNDGRLHLGFKTKIELILKDDSEYLDKFKKLKELHSIRTKKNKKSNIKEEITDSDNSDDTNSDNSESLPINSESTNLYKNLDRI